VSSQKVITSLLSSDLMQHTRNHLIRGPQPGSFTVEEITLS
jgi:hypothetical protein